MSDYTETDTPKVNLINQEELDELGPKPPEEEGFIWVPVKRVVDKLGRVHGAHWRKRKLFRTSTPQGMRDYKKEWARRKSGGGKIGRPPKSERPQFTSPAHAAYVYDKLGMPLTFLTTFAHTSEYQSDEMRDVLRASIDAVKLAREFINRFVEKKNDNNS